MQSPIETEPGEIVWASFGNNEETCPVFPGKIGIPKKERQGKPRPLSLASCQGALSQLHKDCKREPSFCACERSLLRLSGVQRDLDLWEILFEQGLLSKGLRALFWESLTQFKASSIRIAKGIQRLTDFSGLVGLQPGLVRRGPEGLTIVPTRSYNMVVSICDLLSCMEPQVGWSSRDAWESYSCGFPNSHDSVSLVSCGAFPIGNLVNMFQRLDQDQDFLTRGFM